MEQNDDIERSKNLHAPWRMEYIRLLGRPSDGCFICRVEADPGDDADNLVVWRTARCITIMNKFPYTGGHLLIAPRRHLGQLSDLDEPTLLELMALSRDAVTLLNKVCRADGYNIGLNLGRCAGAGLPEHLHLHVVPRWSGDTNFMAVLADVRVIPQALSDLHKELVAAAKELGLPLTTRSQ